MLGAPNGLVSCHCFEGMPVEEEETVHSAVDPANAPALIVGALEAIPDTEVARIRDRILLQIARLLVGFEKYSSTVPPLVAQQPPRDGKGAGVIVGPTSRGREDFSQGEWEKRLD